MGVDSPHETLDKNAAVNGDALILITFNPNTLNATVLSIPRDTYVPITCFRGQIENKITHAAWYGESCMINTIEKFTGIDIDYYVKINFKGVVKLVDALGGVTIDVPVSFCEQDSNRQWGKKKICLKEGLQTLNGEQALALTRHRKTFIDGDLRRAQHQQLVMRGIINELKDIDSLNTIYKILDAISKNIDTNLTKNQILEFYNVGKDVLAKSKASSDFVTMQQLHLDGWGQTIYDEGMDLPLWNYMYYRASLKEVVEAMEINLGIKQPTLIKEFSYSINKPYTPKVIGDGHYKRDYIIYTLPDFTKNSRAFAENWGLQNNIKMTFITIDKNSSEYKDKYVDGQIIYQSVPAYYRVAKIDKEKGITLKIVKKEIIPEKINCSLEENYNNPQCLLPDFTGWTIAQFNNWVTNASGSFLTNTIEITIDDPDYDLSKAGQIFWQSEAVGTKIIDLVELEVKYYAEAEEIGEDGETDGGEEEPPGDEDTEEE